LGQGLGSCLGSGEPRKEQIPRCGGSVYRLIAAATVRMNLSEQAAMRLCYVGARGAAINPQQSARHRFFLRLFAILKNLPRPFASCPSAHSANEQAEE